MFKKIDLFPLLLFIFVVGYAFIEGFRMPNLWSANYYLPSFFDGFYRRGLPGTILTLLGDLKYNYYVIASVQFLVLASLLIWIFWVFKKNSLTMFVITAYFVSTCGGFIFHEVGYVDQLLFLILFISLILYDRYRLLSIIVFSSSMLIHELTLFVTVPIYFTFIYIRTDKLKISFMHTLPSLVLFVLIYLFFQTIPHAELHLFMDQVKQHANYSYRYDYYGVFINEFAGKRFKIYYELNSIIPLLLLSFMNVIVGVTVYQIQKRWLLASLITLTGFAPLLLGLFGYDLNRWFFLSFSSLTTIFILFILHHHLSINDVIPQKSSVILLIGYMLFVGNMTIGYFDSMKQRDVEVQSIIEVIEEINNPKVPLL
jgi:hypothetical protein